MVSSNVLKASPRRRLGDAKASRRSGRPRRRRRPARREEEQGEGATGDERRSKKVTRTSRRRPPPSSSSTAPAPARFGPQETGEVRGLEGGAAAVLHLSSWRGRRGSLDA